MKSGGRSVGSPRWSGRCREGLIVLAESRKRVCLGENFVVDHESSPEKLELREKSPDFLIQDKQP
jgi:hypothetical protein